MSDTLKTGNEGEKAATNFLRSVGFLIHALNWRSGKHEIDIIAEKDGVLHFVEVKTRTEGGWQTPEQAMTKRKSALLVKAVNHYVALNEVDCDVQIDLVAVDIDSEGEMSLRYIPQVDQLHW